MAFVSKKLPLLYILICFSLCLEAVSNCRSAELSWAGACPGDIGFKDVCFHKSHMTHVQGHSRLIKKMVAVSNKQPLGPISCSTSVSGVDCAPGRLEGSRNALIHLVRVEAVSGYGVD